VTNAGLAKLATLKSLNTAVLLYTKITVSGLNELNALPELIELDVYGLEQDDSTLNIAGLTKLRWLALRRALLRDEDLACLANLKRLEWVVISGEVTDVGMAHLANLRNLERLDMGGSNLTDKGLAYVAEMKKLKYLQLGGDFTDEGLASLEGLTGLTRLQITSRNEFSPKTLDRLREKLPILSSLRVEKSKPRKK
jgi:Leucine-rich repeat (LRR) protein